MKIHFKTFAAWLGSLLGLVSCDVLGDIGIIGGGMCMYGTPTADYDINISVCDENDNAIPGIKSSVGYIEDEVYSDKSGIIKISVSNAGSWIHMEDVDGEANGGEFESMDVDLWSLTTKQTKKGDGSWYRGKYSVSGKVIMKKK